MPERLATALLGKLRLIWLAMCGSVIIFGVVLSIVEPRSGGDVELVPFVLLAAAIGVTVAVFVVRRIFFGPSLGLFLVREPHDPEPLSSDDAQRALIQQLARFQTGFLVALALSESVALFGFISSFLSNDLGWYLVHATFALLLMVVQFPRRPGLLGGLSPAVRRMIEEA